MIHRLSILGILVVAVGCNSPQGPPIHEIAAEINATLAPIEEAIVPGDVLTITVVNLTEIEVPDLSQELTVPLDGRIQLPGIGVIRAAGRPPAEVGEVLAQAYAPTFGGIAPGVSVGFVSQAGRSYHILGQVKASGEYPIEADGRVTLVEAFARAGGVGYLTSYLGNVLIVRWDPERQRQVSWVVDARTRWWDRGETILLQPNDIVWVPETTILKVNTWIDRYIVRNIPFPRFIVPA